LPIQTNFTASPVPLFDGVNAVPDVYVKTSAIAPEVSDP
jgi:hypothetical protein